MLRLHGLCTAGKLSRKAGASRGSPVQDFASPRRLGVVTSAPPQPVGSSTASESQPGPHTVVNPATMSRPPVEPITDNAVDNKIRITVSVRRVAEKRKVVQAMSGPAPEGSSGPIGWRVIQHRDLMRLLSFAPSHSGDVLVIPDDDVRVSEGRLISPLFVCQSLRVLVSAIRLRRVVLSGCFRSLLQ
ncbi:unnamed protein product [Lactuca virosa]|uniref:Uncharacterized protein n=1 Tax=Lactuca virosa TaxID=75947 RepID=A0AAU9PBB7_9ASTR|nr:unnamed protein product [Lactuca virosa]